MTAEEVVDFFAPRESTVDAVTAWLAESGISSDRFAVSVNKQVLSHTSVLTFMPYWYLLISLKVDSIRCNSV